MFIILNYHISTNCCTILKIQFSKLCKEFCKEDFIEDYFSYKDPIPNDLKSFLVYKFTRASCSASYIGATCCHFKTKIEEHIKKDNKSHILNTYTPLQDALTQIILFLLK